MTKRFTPILISLLSFLLVWYLITRYSGIPNFILPSPLSVWTRFLKAVNDGSLPYHTGITLVEIVLGLLTGVLFATVVGYLLAKSRSLEKVLSPELLVRGPLVGGTPALNQMGSDKMLNRKMTSSISFFRSNCLTRRAYKLSFAIGTPNMVICSNASFEKMFFWV